MRALLFSLLACSCVTDEPLDDSKCWPPFIEGSPAPVIEMPTLDADGKLTADQIAVLQAQIDAVHLYEQRVDQALTQYRECRLYFGYER